MFNSEFINASYRMLETAQHVLDTLDTHADIKDVGHFYATDGITFWVHENFSIQDDTDRRTDVAHRFALIAKSLAFCGTVEKNKSDMLGMYLELPFNDRVAIRVYASTLCERIQTGTELRPVTKTIETGEYEEVPTYETRCPDSILNV